MCGRYALSLGSGDVRARIEEQANNRIDNWADENNYHAERGFNIAPRTRNPIVLRGGGSGDSEAEHDPVSSSHGKQTGLRMENMQWGLIPHWMKRKPDFATALKTINARDDTIIEGSSMWKSIRGRRRCVVIAEGFYEWLKKGADKIPHHVKRKDGKLMLFAGLWDTVTFEGEQEPLHTYTIITTNSNKQLAFLHDRMPVILDSPEAVNLWLDTSNNEWTKELASLLKPFEGPLECYPVPKEVGKVGNQSADFLKPVSERKGNIAGFFSKQAKATESNKSEDTSPSSKGPQSNQSCNQSSKVPLKDETSTKMLFNSDEKDDVEGFAKQSPPAGSRSKKKAKPGAAAAPITLDDSDEEATKPVKSKSSLKKSSDSPTHKRKRESHSPDHEPLSSAKKKGRTDDQGNKKLENFFEVQD